MEKKAPLIPTAVGRSTLFKGKHGDIFAGENMKKYFGPLLGYVAFQFSIGFPFVLCGVMVGSVGDTLSLAIFGLGRTLTSICYLSITNAITEVLGVSCSKLFARKDFPEIASILWKTLFSILVLNIINAVLFYKSYNILRAINIEDQLSYMTAEFLVGSIPYLLIQGLNSVLVALLASMSLNQLFVYINVLSIVVVGVFGRLFIVTLGYKHMGFLYAKVIQEGVSLACYLLIVARQVDREALALNPLAAFRNSGAYFKTLAKTVLSFYGESLGFEVSTYYAALLHSINDLALFCGYINYSYLISMVGYAAGNCFRTTIGQIIGEQRYQKAKLKAQQFYVYNFIPCMLLTLFTISFKYDIGLIYTGDEILMYQLADCLFFYGFFIYAIIGNAAAVSLCRLLGLDDLLLKLQMGLYPLLVAVVGYTLCFVLRLGVLGIILGIMAARLTTFVYLMRNLFYVVDWRNPKG